MYFYTNYLIFKLLFICAITFVLRKVNLNRMVKQKDGKHRVHIFSSKPCWFNLFFAVICCGFYLAISYLVFFSHPLVELVTVLGLVLYRVCYKLSPQEKETISTLNNLTLGDGCASTYYSNYLNKVVVDNLPERINSFESKHHVRIARKLYILFPVSCKVKKYVTAERVKMVTKKNNIDRCRELPIEEKNIAGVEKRAYNITVYEVISNEPKVHFRCILEYAQPLKALMAMKDSGELTVKEMQKQSRIFANTLRKRLDDSKSSHDHIEIVEYDDKVKDVADVLLSLKSIQDFLKE